jgi:hypothetical protein
MFPRELAAGMLAVVGLLLIFSALSRRGRRLDLTERRRPYQPPVADETQRWLERQADE